jgi:hypothetical protein
MLKRMLNWFPNSKLLLPVSRDLNSPKLNISSVKVTKLTTPNCLVHNKGKGKVVPVFN